MEKGLIKGKENEKAHMENCSCGSCCHLDLDFLERQAGRVPQIPV